MGFPVVAHAAQGGLRERDIAVFCALAPVDVNAFALCVDIRHLEEERFMESEAAGINDGEVGLVLDGVDCVDNGPDLLCGHNRREGFISFGIDEFEGMPVAVKDIFEKELDAAVADSHSS